MNTRKPYVMLVVLVLAAVACTCGPLSNITSAAEQAAEEAVDEALQEASETVEAMEIETEEPVEEQGEAEVEEAPEQEEPPANNQEGVPSDFVLGETGLESLSSYEYLQIVDFEVTGTDGQPVHTHMEVHVIHQAEPFANSIRTDVKTEGLDDESGRVNNFSSWFVFLDGISYTETDSPEMGGRNCFAVPGDQAELEANSYSYYDLDPDAFSKFDSQPEFMLISDDEDINGVSSTHYRAENININSVESGVIDVWIANDGGYMTRMIMEGVGQDNELGAGQFDMSWELMNVNQPVNITPPADC